MGIPFARRIQAGRHKWPVDTVESVDIDRYAGKWYEIAAFPAWFEEGCRCSTAEYVYMDDYVEVKDSCRKDGRLVTKNAKAYPVPGTHNSQLRVRFVWPFKSDYWIIALDEDYNYAMVGHPDKKYLWIMSRTPQMDGEVYESLVQEALAKGYNIKKLRKTDQTCAA